MGNVINIVGNFNQIRLVLSFRSRNVIQCHTSKRRLSRSTREPAGDSHRGSHLRVPSGAGLPHMKLVFAVTLVEKQKASSSQSLRTPKTDY